MPAGAQRSKPPNEALANRMRCARVACRAVDEIPEGEEIVKLEARV